MADAPDNDQWLAPRTIDLDNPPPEARLYVELYEREKKEHEALKTEVRTLRDANHQIRLERDHFHEMYVRAGRSALEIENDRNEFKGRLEDMLSKPDETPPWARAENGEVLFGLLMDGSDEEAHDIDTAEALASSLWRAAREARSQRKFLPGDVS